MALRRFLGFSDGELMRSDSKPCSRLMRHTVGVFSFGDDSLPKDMVHGDDSDQDEPRVQETSTSNMANDKDEPLSLFGL
ncbi:hypothetical protein Tco_0092744 [Tanacetum coccineum]